MTDFDATPPQKTSDFSLRQRAIRWAVVLAVVLVVLLLPVPSGITPQSWRLLAIFLGTITGSILRPIPGGAVVLMGVSAVAITGALPVGQALGGYADPIVWLVLAAFFIARAMVKTGLGHRIALLFIRAIGHHTLGLGYALVFTEMLLASIIPSTGARVGGVIFPITRSISDTYDSKPGPTSARLGGFLTLMLYQCEVIICAMFLTGQASNVLVAKFAQQTAGIDLSYGRWLVGAIVPALIALVVVPQLVYRLYPPEIKHTPEATNFARTELQKMGRMKWPEWVLLTVFLLVATLWMIRGLSGFLPASTSPVVNALGYLAKLDYSIPPLLGVCALLITGVLSWDDVTSEKTAWDVFLWYGGLVRMAEALGETGITKRFAEAAASFTTGWPWWVALATLLFIYFYSHYGFASITAHVSSMYIPFLVVIIAAGAPAYLAALMLAYLSNLAASLTHYGTTSAPIYFGGGYVSQKDWWRLGLIMSLPNILIWAGIGLLWWKILRWW